MNSSAQITAVNINPRIYADIHTMLGQKQLKSFRYKSFKNLVLDSINIPIPGLDRTSIEGTSTNQMVPQGICCTGQYLLITSYAHRSSSAYTSLIVLNLDGSYVKTIGLKPKVHAGGIAFHPQSGYIWISCDEPGKNTARLMCVHLDTILNQKEGTALDELSYHLFYITELPRSSYLTIYKNFLYAGYFSQKKTGKFYTISLEAFNRSISMAENRLKVLYKCNTRNYIQGVSFVEMYSKQYAIFSQSYGRRSDNIFMERGSKLLVYQYNSLDNADFSKKPDKRICMPVMLEQTYPYQNHVLFSIFESASHVYYDKPAPAGGNSKNQLDHICGLNLKKIIL